jgi:hypothetical protein
VSFLQILIVARLPVEKFVTDVFCLCLFRAAGGDHG